MSYGNREQCNCKKWEGHLIEAIDNENNKYLVCNRCSGYILYEIYNKEVENDIPRDI